MRKTLKYLLVALLAAVGPMTGSLVVATPAHAYVNSSGWWPRAAMRTDSCNYVYGQTYVYGGDLPGSDDCFVQGERGQVVFKYDPGGIAFYAEYSYRAERVASVEFHPNGEVLRVCDLKNDGDTVYFRLGHRYVSSGNAGSWRWKSLVSAPGTSSAVECTTVNYDFIDGTDIRIYMYDDAAMNDLMAGYGSIRA